MKRKILSLSLIISSISLMAQTEFDALKMVEHDINGTARYMSMGGAFGALGGDASAIKDNPAGLGIFRKSEFTGTLNALIQQTGAKWNGSPTSYDDLYKLNGNNFAFVLAVPTWRSESGAPGLINSNWAFNYNRLKNFNRRLNIVGGASNSSMTDYMAYLTSAYRQKYNGGIPGSELSYTSTYEPFDNLNVPWLSILAYEGYLLNESASNSGTWSSLLNAGEKVNPSYTLEEKGYIDEYSLGWSGNISNKFYVGASVNMRSIQYSANSVYGETFGAGGGMSLANTYSTTGTGVNVNLGAIFVPVDFMRLGLSLHTPTFYSLTDYNYAKLDYNTEKNGWIATPEDAYTDYKIQSPLRYDVSVAFIAGQRGLISAEYSVNNFTGTRLMDDKNNTGSYRPENDGMREMMNNARTIKVGGEYRITDNFSLRAGYANTSTPTKSTAAKYLRDNTIRTDTEYFLRNRTDYLTLGLGYQEASWRIDFAYMNRIQDDDFYPYNSGNLGNDLKVDPARVITQNNNLVLTVGFKF